MVASLAPRKTGGFDSHNLHQLSPKMGEFNRVFISKNNLYIEHKKEEYFMGYIYKITRTYMNVLDSLCSKSQMLETVQMSINRAATLNNDNE